MFQYSHNRPLFKFKLLSGYFCSELIFLWKKEKKKVLVKFISMILSKNFIHNTIYVFSFSFLFKYGNKASLVKLKTWLVIDNPLSQYHNTKNRNYSSIMRTLGKDQSYWLAWGMTVDETFLHCRLHVTDHKWQ